MQPPEPLTATYVLVPPSCLDSADRVLSRLRDSDHCADPIQLCRQLPEDAAPADIPVPLVADSAGAVIVDEAWHASISWLARALASGIDPRLASRLVIRIPWPLSPETELTLLEARLSAPGLRLAVPVTSVSSQDVFLYLNRLQFPWVSLPADGETLGDWSNALARMSQLWCLDPRTRTAMEPFQTAFVRILTSRLGQPLPTWRYRVVDARGVVLLDGGLWSPSAHALLVARGREALAWPLDTLPHSDESWLAPLRRIAASVDTDRLGELLQPASAPAGSGGGS